MTYDFHFDEELRDTKILKLILQPIVENAIYHGIRQVDRNGCIHINAKRESNDILFTISDNGDGFDLSTQTSHM